MLDEHQVIGGVCRFLQECGYTILQQLTTAQHGIDVIAIRPGADGRLLIEAKGGTSSQEGSARSGLAFTSSQVENRVAKAVLKLMRLHCRERQPKDVVAIALPSRPEYQRKLTEVRPLLESNGWGVFWLREDETVAVWWPEMLGPPPRRTRIVDGIDFSHFAGPVSVRELTQGGLAELPSAPGNYVVMRREQTEPRFLPRSEAGHFKGKDPTYPLSGLASRWVTGAQILYLGRTGDLVKRVRQLCDFALGKPIGHWGGRILWQIHGWQDFEVWWRATDDADSKTAKKTLLQSFSATHGHLPYANLRE